MLSRPIMIWTSEHFYIELNIDIMPDNQHEHFSTSTVNIVHNDTILIIVHTYDWIED